MAVAEIEGGGAFHVRGRVRGGGHNGVPSCVATPTAGRAWVSKVRNRARALHATTGKEELVVGVYVDDLIVAGVCTEDINSFKREMVARF